MIPKVIHYIWLGDTMPNELQNYVNSWEKALPDYTFIKWSMSNWNNESKYPIVRDCLANKMYAHASDIIRLDVLLSYGGIYLDTDVSIHKSFDSLLDTPLFLGRIYRNLLGSAVIGSEKNNQLLKTILKEYENITLNEIKYGNRFDTNNSTLTYFFLDNYNDFKLDNVNQTMNDGTKIFKKEYFEQPSVNSHINYAVHHYMGSWRNKTNSAFEKFKVISRFLIPPYIYGQISSSRGAKKNNRFDVYKKSATNLSRDFKE
ncbi:glycosyltransferase family 32 protein [Alkalibacterium olivapovliticus]|uniref:Glycosyl transferase-like sugar-binding protein n=1 Tax=Alkalibacterium olivapovliticus TaxID=99907 RepID=A0A2T0W6Y8_9LACT|nr:glycosyltransferase [Alkalibacterium olivapovliticus]PRY82462.1 glycosyl transferase-like sugar-binding protein [Alkalibacterium olivapovliticus]